MSVARKRQQLNLQELYQINWFLGAGLALLSISPAFYLDIPVLPHLLGACFLIIVAMLRPQITTFLPRIIWQAIPFVLIILLAVDLHLFKEPIPALVRLNILLVLYRALAFRRKREDLQLIVLSLFLVIIAGVMTVTFAFPFLILLFTAVAMSFLFNITLMEDSRDTIAPREVWRFFTWRRFLRKIFSRCDAGFLVVSGIAFSSVIAFSVLLFVAIPRFDVNNPLPFFGMNRAAQTGFSESIRFGDVTNIRNDDRVALRVEVATAETLPADPYWRMLVLDEYVNGGFRLSLGLQHNARSQRKISRINHGDALIDGHRPKSADNVWTFYLEGGVARYLPLTGIFERIRFQEVRDFIYLPQAHVLGTTQVNSNMLVYQVENMEFGSAFKDPDFGNYTLEYDWYPEFGFAYDYQYRNYPDTTVSLPPSQEDVEYLRALVDEIGGGEASTAWAFAEHAVIYLQARHTYSMDYAVPSGEGDHVVRWLKSGQPGHCEVFAGSLLLICRAAGIPARVVTGFRGGSWNTYENYFMVRNSDAHAWVEIFDGKDSWLTIDPTPGGGPSALVDSAQNETHHIASDSSLAAYVDSLRILWYRRIVSFDQTSQSQIWSSIQETYGRINLKEWLSDLKAFLTDWWRAPWDFNRLIELLGLAAAGGLIVLLAAFFVRQDASLLSLFSPGTDDPVRRTAGRQLQRLRSLPAAKTPEEARERTLEEIRLELQRLRYGPPHARDNWRQIIKRSRRFVRAWR